MKRRCHSERSEEPRNYLGIVREIRRALRMTAGQLRRGK